MSRAILMLLLLLLPRLAVANVLLFGHELRRFVREIPCLASTHDVERFKRDVARQTVAALAQIALLAAPAVLFFVGIARGLLGPGDLLLVILPAAVVIAVAAQLKRTELRARQISAADEEVRQQRNAVVATWMKKSPPDWSPTQRKPPPVTSASPRSA